MEDTSRASKLKAAQKKFGQSAPTEGGWTSQNRARVAGDAPKGEVTPSESLESLTTNELRKALAKKGMSGPPINNLSYSALVKASKTSGVFQGARVTAVAEWKKKYGQEEAQK